MFNFPKFQDQNNSVEAWHRCWNYVPIYKFIQELQAEQAVVETTIQKIIRGEPCPAKRKVTISPEKQIQPFLKTRMSYNHWTICGVWLIIISGSTDFVKVNVVSLFVIGVCLWAILEPINYSTIKAPNAPKGEQVNSLGHAPRLGTAAGVLLLMIGVSHYFGNLQKKQNIGVGVLLICVAVALSIAAMSIAISDIKHTNDTLEVIKKRFPDMYSATKVIFDGVIRKFTAVAAVTGVATMFEICTLFVGFLVCRDVIKG